MSLSNPEIIVQPPVSEVSKLLGRLVRNMVEGTKAFIRWMNKTCIETPEQTRGDDEEPILFTFYSDIAANPQVLYALPY